MNSNHTNKHPKSIRTVISIMGLIIVIIGMVASVQVENSLIPAAVMILGTIIILVAEKTALDEKL